MRIQENQLGLKVSGTHYLLSCSGEVNLSGDNVNPLKKNSECLINASKEVGLVENTEKNMC